MSSSGNSGSIQTRLSRWTIVGMLVAYLVGLAIILTAEIPRLKMALSEPSGVTRWLVGRDVDEAQSLLLLACFAAAPIVWLGRARQAQSLSWLLHFVRVVGPLLSLARSRSVAGRRMSRSWLTRLFDDSSMPRSPDDNWSGWGAWIGALAVAATSLLMSYHISAMPAPGLRDATFGELPPAYHDEYSYLFQAKTFLAGRLSYPAHEAMPELFDQMHVVNVNGRFASRYFPGAGAWIAPFLAIGHPYWAQWLAGALSAAFVFWAGRELGGNGVGLLAGLLTALSPGMGLFSNLLLAHHATLMGLTFFTFTFLRMLRTQKWTYALWAGMGLAFAMVSRPMTAAGFAFPFGVWLLGWLIRQQFPTAASGARRWQIVLAMSVPLATGSFVLLVTNHSITGSFWTSPYQLYTDTYTPRHVYGFNNRVKGEQHLGPHVMQSYDEWAENLTPTLAVDNVKKRAIATWRWSLGIIPLVCGTIVFFFTAPARDRRWWLLPASIVSLHAAHVPYWFVGIMNWHYVFESGPLWLLMFAGASQALFLYWRESGRALMPGWWLAFLLVTLLPTFTTFDPIWSHSRLDEAVSEVAFPRERYLAFQNRIVRSVGDQRALILVQPDLADRSIDFVVNDPALDADVLIGRDRDGKADVEAVRRSFPDRAIFRFKAGFNLNEWRLTPVR